jgi:hypothetical protein
MELTLHITRGDRALRRGAPEEDKVSQVALQDTDTRRRLEVAIQDLGRPDLTDPERHAAKNLRQVLSHRRPIERRSFGELLWAGMYRLLLYTVKTGRFMVDAVLGLLTLVFLAIWGLALPHPPKWDVWWGVELIRGIGEPVLARIDAVLDWPEAVPFYPFMLVFLFSVGRVVVDSRIARVLRRLRELEPRAPRQHTYTPINWRLEQDAEKHH